MAEAAAVVGGLHAREQSKCTLNDWPYGYHYTLVHSIGCLREAIILTVF